MLTTIHLERVADLPKDYVQELGVDSPKPDDGTMFMYIEPSTGNVRRWVLKPKPGTGEEPPKKKDIAIQERIRQYRKEYYLSNRERIIERQRQYFQKCKREKIKAILGKIEGCKNGNHDPKTY